MIRAVTFDFWGTLYADDAAQAAKRLDRRVAVAQAFLYLGEPFLEVQVGVGGQFFSFQEGQFETAVGQRPLADALGYGVQQARDVLGHSGPLQVYFYGHVIRPQAGGKLAQDGGLAAAARAVEQQGGRLLGGAG